MNKILIVDSNHSLLKQGLEDLGFICDEDYTSSKEMIEKKILEYIGLVIRSRFKIDKPFLDAGKNLKFIARVGAGLESIDEKYADTKGIALIAAPEGNRNAVGEHALGMLLSVMNNLNRADQQIRKGLWLREANRGEELEGKTIGIIGYGNMGKAFARKLRGFGVKVICYDILPEVGDKFCTQVTLQELQNQTDVLSLHVPHNELSFKMVNRDFINKFKKPFYLINTARGTVVDTKDLVWALENRKIKKAALDVLEYEQTSFENLFEHKNLPTAFQYLIQSDRVLLTPHIAGWSNESEVKLAQVIVDKIKVLFG